VIRTAVAIKSWIAQTPSVDEVRPSHCAGCGAASRPVGACLVVHGQGLLQRQVRGVLEVDGRPGVVSIAVRRYECQRCKAVMTVVPAGMLAGRQYSAPSIALALHLWLALVVLRAPASAGSPGSASGHADGGAHGSTPPPPRGGSKAVVAMKDDGYSSRCLRGLSGVEETAPVRYQLSNTVGFS
jgi:hypothetical protein